MQNIIDLEKFKSVAPQMFWGGAAVNQIDMFEKEIAALSNRVRLAAEVVGSHRSKSINLPVVKITTDAGEFTLRDNFYDTNMMAILRQPATLSLDQFFADVKEPLTWEWYLHQIDRARNYSWREWTDEEMNDPRVLRVRDKRAGLDMWWEKKGEEKDRWAIRMSNPAWYSRDWAGGELTWDGAFGPGVKMYLQDRAHAEGIVSTTSNMKYMKGISDFLIAVDSLTSATKLIERLTRQQ